MWLNQLSAPASTPISLSEAKAHLRVLTNDEDTLITALIAVATTLLEGRHGVLGRALITQQWEHRIDGFPTNGFIELPLPPLQTVEAVKYIDDAGTEQTVDSSDYVVDAELLVGRIRPAYNVTWPSTRCEPHAVRIEFTAGYGVAADVPDPLKQAMLLLIGHFYLNREATSEKTIKGLPFAVEALISGYQFRPV